MKKRLHYDMLLLFVLASIYIWFIYHITFVELQNIASDLNGHLYIYLPFLTNIQEDLTSWMGIPYFLWHGTVLLFSYILPIPLEVACAYTNCLYYTATMLILYWMISRYKAYHGITQGILPSSVIAFILCVIQPVYFSWFQTTSQYIGQFSMNPLHNPTFMCVKPFSLICLCAAYDLLQKQHQPHTYKGVFFSVEKSTKKVSLILSISLMLSTLAKPTFAEMFIPTVGLYMLFQWIYKLCKSPDAAKPYFQQCLKMLLLSVPALCMILFQFSAYFLFGGSYSNSDAHVVLTTPFYVWSQFTDNILFSILLGMLFPIYMLIINWEYFWKSTLGRISILSYLVSLTEAAILSENGDKMLHGDFLWPMMSGMLILWVTATLRLYHLSDSQVSTKGQQIALYIGWLIFLVQGFYGLYFLFSFL